MTAGATYETMNRAAEVAAAKVARASHLGYEELRQEAWLAVLASRTTYDPSRGVPFGAYACQAGVYACQRLTWNALKDHVRQAQIGLNTVGEEVVPDAGQGFDAQVWRDQVRTQVRRILLQPGVNPEALRLILQGTSAQELADQQGKSRQTIYNESWELRRRLKADPVLRRLWRER